MARRGGTEGLVFELVPDDGVPVSGTPSTVPAPDGRPAPGDAPLASDGGPPAIAPSVLTLAARAASAWLRDRTPLQVVAGVAGLALVAGAVGVAAELRERAADARLQAAPGGVLDLSQPVRERWSRIFDVAANTTGTRYGIPVWPVGVLDDEGRPVLVVGVADTGPDPSPVATVVGTILHGLDLDDGAERWQLAVDEDTVCGSDPISLSYDRLAIPGVAARLVCTFGRGTDGRVLVVEPDGSTTERTPEGLDALTSLLPGPGGTVVRIERDTGNPEHVELQNQPSVGWQVSEGFAAPVHVVTAEDPLTGRTLWRAERSGGWIQPGSDITRCVAWEGDGPQLDVASVTHSVTDDGMILRLCGVDVVLAADGTEVAASETGRASVAPEPLVQSLADGGLGVVAWPSRTWSASGTHDTVVYDSSGNPVLSLEAGVLDPWTSDGTGGIDLRGTAGRRDGVLVVHDESRLQAVDRDGEVQWDVVDRPVTEGAVARADGVVVLVRRAESGEGELVGVGLDAGEERWTAPLGGFGGFGGGAWMYLRGAWTDGDHLAVVVPGAYGDETPPQWRAYDLRTGAVAWRVGAEATSRLMSPMAQCLAVAGRLLCLDGDRLVRVA